MKSKPEIINIEVVELIVPVGFHVEKSILQQQINSDLVTSCLEAKEVAKLFKIKLHTLQNRISSGKHFPPHFKVKGSRKRFFPRSWIDLYLGMQA